MQVVRSHSQSRRKKARFVAVVACAWTLCAGASVVSMLADAAPKAIATDANASRHVAVQPAATLDRSGNPRVGKASFYANRYHGKTMADGTPMSLYSNNAASLTLPLGTTARVTNLETGRSTWVTIRDRGPYIKGRIIDLSPATAHQIGLERKRGLATVEVAPMEIPLLDGSIKTMPAHLAMTQPRVHSPESGERGG